MNVCLQPALPINLSLKRYKKEFGTFSQSLDILFSKKVSKTVNSVVFVTNDIAVPQGLSFASITGTAEVLIGPILGGPFWKHPVFIYVFISLSRLICIYVCIHIYIYIHIPLGRFPVHIGHTPRGSYSRKGVLLPSRCLLESPFLEPLLRTLLRTLLPIKTHCKTPSDNPS